MPKLKSFTKQLHWKILLIRILVNSAAMALTVLLVPNIYFVQQTFWVVLIIAVGLGILNALVKPFILLLTGQLIFVTFGLLVILVNALILYLLEWLFPSYFVVNGLFWALVGGAILGLVSNALENLMGLAPPIIAGENGQQPKRIEGEHPNPVIAMVAKPQMVLPHDVETQSVSELTAARAALDVLQGPEVTPDSARTNGDEQTDPTAGGAA